MANRFDLEQQILDAWKVTDEIELVYDNIMNRDMSKDDIVNILLGLKGLYSLKFERMWATFEECVHKREL